MSSVSSVQTHSRIARLQAGYKTISSIRGCTLPDRHEITRLSIISSIIGALIIGVLYSFVVDDGIYITNEQGVCG